ncbi:hypothetical protein MPDQ_005920 [Monascus purpureus]|uniref:Molybdenum cofactor sulfurase n=1 Tax=Monascus purpureus TaxID=5098 RepID=A0A507QYY4_MONPU|nr:hypothetical protein MPDQ_005920 [Monascus purpureus]BDD64028.1 hypothetical protein MAP00_008879 [Monascus purpureus]
MEGKPEKMCLDAEYCKGYSEDVDLIRKHEYPMLDGTTYLDHAGTTLYAKSLIDSFSHDLTSSLFGNPHSKSASSQLSTRRIDDIRLRALRFFNTDPEVFDLVFVANATAAIKLVADALRDLDSDGFWYGYHIAAHTSLVGVRELANAGSRCFSTDAEVETWISELSSKDNLLQRNVPKLFAFPAQSNMNGRRLPVRWCQQVRQSAENSGERVFTLLDAASLVSTSPLDLGDVSAAPDFTAISFYKIFGFPDLGALIVRKSAAYAFDRRRFFGGGTVGMVTTLGTQWHARKETSIHGRLEDGTLPFHNIIALDAAFRTHERLYGSMTNISSHTRFLAKRLYDHLWSLTHANGVKVCEIYKSPSSDYEDPSTQGPIIAFNLRTSRGEWVGKSEVEKLAAVRNIEIRSGTLCNPGGTASSLGWSGTEQRRHYSSGLRCGDDHDVMDGRPTGILRASLGAMTNMRDIDMFVDFIREFYVEKITDRSVSTQPVISSNFQSRFYVEALCVYPIKSCAAFKVPDGKRWEVKTEGLAWDREWCLIHQGTGAALSQKRYPLMALIHPFIDLDRGILKITCGGSPASERRSLEISLSRDYHEAMPASLCQNSANKSSTVCGDRVIVHAYSSPAISSFFSDFLGVPCTLARFPPQSSTRYCGPRRLPIKSKQPDSFPQGPSPEISGRTPILLSNESPILVISRSSVNHLNETIKATSNHHNHGISKAVAADVFRANIIVAENLAQRGDLEQPYIEDNWVSLTIGPRQLCFDILGSCQRCQMVCIDQYSGVRCDEPFSTLAKTRKFDGKVLFGRHAALSGPSGPCEILSPEGQTLMVGDLVTASYDHAR